MPQMAPMWWTTLYFINIISMSVIMVMIYYMFLYKINKMKTPKKTKNNINWKW